MFSKLNKIFTLAVCIFTVSLSASAQQETLDFLGFTPPQGWTKTSTTKEIVVYSNHTDKDYCIIGIYGYKKSSGNIETDFQTEWQNLVATRYEVKDAPTKEAVSEQQGWKSLTGSATRTDELGTSLIILNTVSGYGKMGSIFIMFNSREYTPSVEKFWASIGYAKQNPNDAAQNPASPQLQTSSGGNSSGISKSTTSFSDGWTATIHDEYVLLSKSGTNVYLFYAIPTDRAAIGNSLTDYYWRMNVLPRFDMKSVTPWQGPSYDFIDFAEGVGIDKQSGQSCYVGMRVVSLEVGDGMNQVIVASAPDRQSYQAQFPHPDKLRGFLSTNRFAVTRADLIGHWKGGSGNAATLYNVYTGANAGMAMSTGSEEFVFNPDGAFRSRQVGSTGMVGNSQIYDTRSTGRFNVTDWEVAVTDSKGETTVYTAHFEAVKGGRILHLTDKRFTGNQYHLVKVK